MAIERWLTGKPHLEQDGWDRLRKEAPAARRFPHHVASGVRRRASQRDDRRGFGRYRTRLTGTSRRFLSTSGRAFARQRLASGESFFYSVPVRDLRFVHLPAQVDELAAAQRGKIDQSKIDVLDDATMTLDRFDA